jgi:hypothetical protein
MKSPESKLNSVEFPEKCYVSYHLKGIGIGSLWLSWIAPHGTNPKVECVAAFWLYASWRSVIPWRKIKDASGSARASFTRGCSAIMPRAWRDWLASHVQALLVLDAAGWHRSAALVIPDNLTLLHLPAYSPKLNPAEWLWRELRQRHLSNRV